MLHVDTPNLSGLAAETTHWIGVLLAFAIIAAGMIIAKRLLTVGVNFMVDRWFRVPRQQGVRVTGEGRVLVTRPRGFRAAPGAKWTRR